jgi:phage terminase large subunit-like protein
MDRKASAPLKRDNLNVYIVVDPANSKKKSADYTVMLAIGLAANKDYLVLDIVRDRLSFAERADRLFDLVAKWKPIAVGYEA